MSPRLSSLRTPRIARIVVAALLAMLLLIIAAATWKPLHEWLHNDADEADHHCAVTLLAAGSCDTSFVDEAACHPPLPLPADRVVPIESWVQNLFLSACVCEHGPPRNS
jgi:hypothetical protein